MVSNTILEPVSHAGFTFILLRAFDRQAEGVIDDEGLRAVQTRLNQKPDAGASVAGTGGMRKLRVAASGRGRRGGARVIYYARPVEGFIFLIAVYPKGTKEDLTATEKKYFKSLTAILEQQAAKRL